jgi:RHS repeat-associated protein
VTYQEVVCSSLKNSGKGGAGIYRYGFNGKEKDPEGMGGGGSTYDYGFRIYNPQIARFLSVDPLTKSYPWYTPYQFAGNKPIWAIDLDGLEEFGAPFSYQAYKYNSPLSLITKDSYNKYDGFKKTRTGQVMGGTLNMAMGTVGAIGSFLYSSETLGAGAALGGSTAMMFSLGEISVGLAQVVDGFCGNDNVPDNVGSVPGLVAELMGSPYSGLVDAFSQLLPSLTTGGLNIENPSGLIKSFEDFASNPNVFNTLSFYDNVMDATGFISEGFDLNQSELSKAKNFKTNTTNTIKEEGNNIITTLTVNYSYRIQDGSKTVKRGGDFSYTKSEKKPINTQNLKLD